MRKNIIFLLLTAVTALLLLGCPKNTDTITFAVGGAPAELDFWEAIISDFKEQTGYEVEMLHQPTDTDQRRQNLVVALRSGKSDIDVFLMDVAWIAQFAASEWLEPISSHLADSELKEDDFFTSVVKKADYYNNELIALPVYVDGGLLYYRTDLLQQAGIKKPPKTWNDLLQYSLQIQQLQRQENSDFYGFVWQGAQYEGLVCTFLEFAGSFGGGEIVKDNNIYLNTEANREALAYMQSLIQEYKISPPSTYTEMKEEEVRIYFQNGNALFERNWPYAWAQHNSDESKVKGLVGIAPLPSAPNGSPVSTLGGWHIGMSRNSDNKEKSWAFIKYVLSYDTQKKLALNLGWNPGRSDVYTDVDVLTKMPHFAQLEEVFEYARPRPMLPYYTQISEVIQRHVNMALAGKATPEEALSAAETEARKVIERYIMEEYQDVY